MIYKNILQTIGNTPLVRINNFGLSGEVSIFAKIEGFNPGGSIKDRVALRMIEQAEAEGKLTFKKTVIEATSGNTGIALAMICAVKGYKAKIVMSEAVSVERRKMISAFGAEIVLTDPTQGTDGAIRKVKDLIASDPESYYGPDQFSNSNNILAHYETTAQEIWQQTNGEIDYICASIGTSGTLMGISRYLKMRKADIKVVSAEPTQGHYIQGLKNMEEAIVPSIYDKTKLDEIIPVESEKAFETARQIIKKEGIFVGMSSGAAMYAGLEIAKKITKGSIVVIFPDRGEKYLSTSLFG